eukprot:CAMPEP_0168611446 /NCGR_PEP_ID=MMETSP0449_2-20121227/2364_1 /TAXON_ID=1082188 /ORGANISM="Strombidium rassoulzadegani, Strain ras09" /LENGTH=76 /DNA_ID=CAMNT_0008651897 /DNA_START=280 /DNA_END=510 /DNA_ORIENTATION=-
MAYLNVYGDGAKPVSPFLKQSEQERGLDRSKAESKRLILARPPEYWRLKQMKQGQDYLGQVRRNAPQSMLPPIVSG